MVAARTVMSFAVCGMLAACGSSEPSAPAAAPQPTPAPTPPPAQGPDFGAIEAAVDDAQVADMAVLIGNEDEILFTYEKGDFSVSRDIIIASASKLVFGLLAWKMVENGTLDETSQPQDVIDFWTDEPSDPRADITFAQLLSFTSGLNARPNDGSCPGDGSISLRECVMEIFDEGIETAPGSTFFYGPKHMTTAAQMIASATGQEVADVLVDEVTGPLGIAPSTRYPAADGDNPLYSGGMISSALDYAAILSALLKGDILADRDGFLETRTKNAAIGFQPAGIEDRGTDWRYGFGFWVECDAPDFTPECEDALIISSPGGAGFTPWIDFDAGYWGIIAMQEARTLSFTPAAFSVGLEQELQPLIRAALAQ